MEVLGTVTLFGVMLIDATSRRMEVAMCELTIFSVSMLCYVLADIDSPFNGFFRVDTSVLPDVVKRLENLYRCAQIELKLEQVMKEGTKNPPPAVVNMKDKVPDQEYGVEDIEDGEEEKCINGNENNMDYLNTNVTEDDKSGVVSKDLSALRMGNISASGVDLSVSWSSDSNNSSARNSAKSSKSVVTSHH